MTPALLNFLSGILNGVAFGLGMILPSYWMGRSWGKGCKDGQR